jgi:hypothetical protein
VTEERRSRSYARRRDLRATPPATAAPPGDGWPGPRQAGPDADVAAGPTTQELALYRPDPVLPARRNDLELPPASPDGDRGERTRAFVERWSLWASGLGKPPREPSGGRRYPAGDSMLVPGLVVAAGLGVAVLIGLLTGVLVSAPGRDAAAAGQLTVTVTQPVTPPAITETETRTRTRTTTVTATPTAEPPQNSDGTVLQPGSQGPEVAQLQQDLAALGFFRRAPDGTYDEETRAAVQAFQAQYQVAGDPPGVAGPGTREALAEAVGRT